MTSVFCTSTSSATDGSTFDSSSTTRTERKKWPPAPPSASGISIPITPRSKSLSISARGISACSSICRTSGATSVAANSRTLARSNCSSSESTVNGGKRSATSGMLVSNPPGVRLRGLLRPARRNAAKADVII